MTTDPWGNATLQRQIAEELERIGADGSLRAGLATNAQITPEQLLAAFRATPTGGGNSAFRATLEQILEGR